MSWASLDYIRDFQGYNCAVIPDTLLQTCESKQIENFHCKTSCNGLSM